MQHNWPLVYLSGGLRLVPLLPRSKMPYRASPDAKTGWQVLFADSADAWLSFRGSHPDCNVAVLWEGCQVDMDSPKALEWARTRGVASSNTAWILRTRKGSRLLYRAPELPLVTKVDNEHGSADLLGPGRLAVVPPSVHPSGVHYRWVTGHTPLDIDLEHLALPPKAVMEFWRGGVVPWNRERPHRGVELRGHPHWLSLVFEAICTHLEATGHRLRPLGGGGFSTTCPLHADRHPSFSVHPVRGWKCFAGCGEGRLTALAAKLDINL